MSARDFDPVLASRVSARLEALQVSPETLAINSDGAIAATTIRNAARGYPPQLKSLRALAIALECTISELLGEDTSIENALPGWAQLDPQRRTMVRRIVADMSAAASDREPIELRRVADESPGYDVEDLRDLDDDERALVLALPPEQQPAAAEAYRRLNERLRATTEPGELADQQLLRDRGPGRARI